MDVSWSVVSGLLGASVGACAGWSHQHQHQHHPPIANIAVGRDECVSVNPLQGGCVGHQVKKISRSKLTSTSYVLYIYEKEINDPNINDPNKKIINQVQTKYSSY